MFYFYFKFFFFWDFIQLRLHSNTLWACVVSRDYKLPSKIQLISSSEISICLSMAQGEVIFSKIDIKAFLMTIKK